MPKKFRSIKYKILLNFVFAVTVLYIATTVILNIKLSARITEQSNNLTDDLKERKIKDLLGYNKLIESRIDQIKSDVRNAVKNLADGDGVFQNIKSQQLTHLEKRLENSCKLAYMDFCIIYDFKGNLQSSYPKDVDPFYSLNLFKRLNCTDILTKVTSGSIPQESAAFDVVLKLDSDFLNAVHLTSKDILLKGCIAVLSTHMIMDDFGEPYAFSIMAKILNKYNDPLKDIHLKTGIQNIIYLDTVPIAYGGFNIKEDIKPLMMLSEHLPEVYAKKFCSHVVNLNNQNYLSVYTNLNDFKGESIGAIFTGMPEEHILKIQQSMIEYGNKTKAEIFWWLMLLCFISVICFIFIGSVIATKVTNPINEVVKISGLVANGDISKRLEITSDDEIAEMSKALNHTFHDLSGMLSRVKDIAQVLVNSSDELSTVSAQLTTTSSEMSIQSENVANSTKEMAETISTVATFAEKINSTTASVSITADEMAVNMNSVASSIEEMSVAIQNIGQNSYEGFKISSDAMDLAKSANEVMLTLGKVAKEIGKVTELIKRIADKTDLLALNATIEAASAGEAGKGFAVVANEIKQLASKSAKEADNIAERIKGVQVNADNAINVFSNVAAIISKLNESAEFINKAVAEQTNSVNDVSKNIQETNTGVVDIAKSVTEVANGINDVSKNIVKTAEVTNIVSENIQGVKLSAAETNSGAEQVNIYARELAKIAVELQTMLKKFTLAS
ncbi:MAG: HAMP domain-containing protein [Desulfobacterales bacterium]|nr:HAMP domain-containing protein [Desulfobacterales bacterium]